MCPPPKPKKAKAPPPPIEAPEVELGAEDKASDIRGRKRRGRNALRTGLQLSAPSGGLNVPE